MKDINDFNRASLCNTIARELGIDTELVLACIPVMLENLELMNRKQHDYGPHNLTKFGTLGVVIRANDKIERLVSLTKPGAKARVNDESIADTLRDLSNYGTIGFVIEKKIWPKPLTSASPEMTVQGLNPVCKIVDEVAEARRCQTGHSWNGQGVCTYCGFKMPSQPHRPEVK